MAYYLFFSDDFGLRSPVIQNNFRQKKVYLYRSMRPQENPKTTPPLAVLFSSAADVVPFSYTE